MAPERVQVLPNVLDPRFTPGPKPVHLLRRYRLEGRRVLLTVAPHLRASNATRATTG